jgi:hypothetical protein
VDGDAYIASLAAVIGDAGFEPSAAVVDGANDE